MTDEPELTGRARWAKEHASPIPNQPEEGSTYHQRAAVDVELDIARSRQRPYVNGSEPTVSVPPVSVPYWANSDTAIEPPLPMKPGDLRSAILGEALGGASQPAPTPFICPYNQADGCILAQGGNPCVCAEMGQ